MSEPAVTPSQDPQRRRQAVQVTGTVYRTVSRRGLDHQIVVVRKCPFCGRPHTHRSAGLRFATCGGGYIVIKPRKAWGTR